MSKAIAIGCPRCSSKHISVQYTGVTYFNYDDDGVLDSVGIGGVLGGDARSIQCLSFECGYTSFVDELVGDIESSVWDSLTSLRPTQAADIARDSLSGQLEGGIELYRRGI